MTPTTDELIDHIRRVLPKSNMIKQFKPDEKNDYVSFHWNGRDFLVRRSLETFEVKSNRVFVTGASMLMQSALSSKSKHQRVLEACIEVLRQAEGMLNNRRTTDQGLKLLAATKVTISKLAGIKSKLEMPRQLAFAPADSARQSDKLS